MNSMPTSFALALSVGLMGRDASEMSVRSSGLASRNFLNPPPVPEMPTVTCTFGCTSLNNSAAAAVMG